MLTGLLVVRGGYACACLCGDIRSTSCSDRSAGACLAVFFFQAEDGIRDRDVTGVQTCALPIYEPTAGMTPDELNRMITIIRKVHEDFDVAIFLIEQIGRASCRERG